MSHETITPPEVPPSPMPPAPGYSPRPRPSVAERKRRRWPAYVAAAAAGAVLASVAAAVVTTQVRATQPMAEQAPAPVVTQAPPAPASPAPAPLPAAQADSQLCKSGWIEAGNLIDKASAAIGELPVGMKISDPAVRENPEWSASVRRGGDYYRQASEALSAQIVPGATPVLAEAANTTVSALKVLSTATTSANDLNGNAFRIADTAANQMGTLCTRLAP